MAFTDDEDENVTEELDTTADPVAIGAAASVLMSLYMYYVEGEKDHGIFIGLWAPTLLGAASYLNQKNLEERFDQGLSFQ